VDSHAVSVLCTWAMSAANVCCRALMKVWEHTNYIDIVSSLCICHTRKDPNTDISYVTCHVKKGHNIDILYNIRNDKAANKHLNCFQTNRQVRTTQ